MWIILTMLILSFSPVSEHDIHVSICEIDVLEDRLELTLKTFLDDLQLAVGLTPGAELPEDYTSADELIASYIHQSIKIGYDNALLPLEIKDIAASPDAVWITITTSRPMKDRKLSLTTTFLTEIYNDQTNLVNIKHGKKKDSFILNGKKRQVQFSSD